MRRSVRKIELIPNFAEKILDAEIEMKLSDHPPKQTIGKLIQLYTLGVEYYQSIRSHKYMYFQIKLNQLFVSASNFASDSPKEEAQLDSPVKRKLKSNSEEEKIQALKIREKQAKMRNNVVEKTNQSLTNKHVKTIIQESKNNEKFQKEKLDSQISKQEQKLTKKLEKRKSRILHSRSLASMMDGASTQQSLFLESENKNNKKPSNSEIKPLQINFNDIIKENDSDNEGNETEETPKKQIEDNPEGKVQLFTKKIDI